MVLDLDLLRKDRGGDPEKVKENQRKRFKDPAMVDKILEADEQWRKSVFETIYLNKDPKLRDYHNYDYLNLKLTSKTFIILKKTLKTFKLYLENSLNHCKNI